jgi:hypothetical protein
MQTLIDKQMAGLVKRYHRLCGLLRMSDDQRLSMLMQNYGVRSSLDLEYGQLLELCNRLDMEVNPELLKLDVARKRLMASIGGWLRAMGRIENIRIIKAIACRASEREDFNKIPLEQLRSLYAAFNKKKKDLAMVEQMTVDELDLLTMCN